MRTTSSVPFISGNSSFHIRTSFCLISVWLCCYCIEKPYKKIFKRPGILLQIQHADRLELSYVAEGCVDCYLDELTKRLNSGDLLIKNAGMIHSEKKIGQGELKEICISFDHVHLDGLPENHMIN